MSASLSAAAAAGGVVVVTHVIPAPQVGAPHNSAENNRWSRAHLAALGTVQIITGLLDFLFGIVMLPYPDGLSFFSGVFVWGALSYVVAGSLVVAAGKSSNRRLVSSSLGFSVAAAVTSEFATVIYTLDAFGVFTHRYWSDSYYGFARVSGVLAGFSLLVCIVSIYIAALECKTSCQSTDELVITTNQSHEAPSQTAEPAYEAPPTAPPPTGSADETFKPQEYSTIMI